MPRGNPRGHDRGRSQGRHTGRHSQLRTTGRSRRLALVAAPVLTVLAVGVGVLTSGFALPTDPSVAASNLSGADQESPTAKAEASDERVLGTSRSTARVPLTRPVVVPKATGKLWTTEDLDLRIEPRKQGREVGLVKSGKHVPVTGRRIDGYAEIVTGGITRWVTADYLSKDKTPEAMGLSNAPCADGSEIESALQPTAVKVYRAACAAFPELSTYGGQDGHGEHVNGEAIDFMVPDSGTGQRLADFLYAHHAQLDLFDIIWSQTIWTIERSGEGFRGMSDRGSATANHYDHVHIKVN